MVPLDNIVSMVKVIKFMTHGNKVTWLLVSCVQQINHKSHKHHVHLHTCSNKLEGVVIMCLGVIMLQCLWVLVLLTSSSAKYRVKAMIKLNKLYTKSTIKTYLIIPCNCFLQHCQLRVLWTCWNFDKITPKANILFFCYGHTCMLCVTLSGIWRCIRVSDVLNSGQVSLLQTQ